MPIERKTGEHDLAAVLTLELIFRTEMDFVMNAARRCGLSDADAEDVTQQVFIALQRRLHTLHSPESVRPWLLTVTRRHAATLIGAALRDPTEGLPDDLGEIEDEAPLPEERIIASERRADLLDLLEAIEPARRVVFVMHLLDDVPMSEIAQVLRIPVATAYNRLRLAREELRLAIERKDLSEEHGWLFRAWEKILTVRDPWEHFYGRAAITPPVRERIWARILDALGRAFPSLAAAEVGALRVLSPLWRDDAPPRPYPRLKPQRKGAATKRFTLGRGPQAWRARKPPPTLTGSRTP